MQDTSLYEQLLGLLPPWRVKEVHLDPAHERVHVFVEHDKAVKWSCPECSSECMLYDHAESRSWRHLDSCHYETLLHARPPRVQCTEHGVRQVKLPWAEVHSRFTALFERFAIDVLKQMSIEAARRVLRLSWEEAWHILHKAVRRGHRRKQAHPLPRIGVDEKAVLKGHRYVTVVTNSDTRCVEYLCEGRTQESLAGFYEGLTPEQKSSIESVSMDMWDPFRRATEQHVLQAETKIVYDPFHILKHMNEAVDRVRRQENRELLALLGGDHPLKQTRYLWLKGQEKLTVDHRYLIERLRKADLKTARAWAIKEHLRGLWKCANTTVAEQYWKKWNSWATHCKLAPVVKVANMVRTHLSNILTYFTHRTTNAIAEGLNSVIQTIKRNARGFRNLKNFKTAIYFHCGGLDLYPDSTH